MRAFALCAKNAYSPFVPADIRQGDRVRIQAQGSPLDGVFVDRIGDVLESFDGVALVRIHAGPLVFWPIEHLELAKDRTRDPLKKIARGATVRGEFDEEPAQDV